MKKIFALVAALAFMPAPVLAQAGSPSAPIPYLLLSNASASGPIISSAYGGSYLLSIAGTFGGSTVTLVGTDPQGNTTTYGTYTSAPAYPTCLAIPAAVKLQATVTGGTPSGLTALLGGIGEGACPGTQSGGATAANQTNVQSAPGTSASVAITVQGSASGVALPVTLSGTSPLPTGAATSALQTSVGATAHTDAIAPQSAPGTPQTIAVTVQGNSSGVAIPVSATSLPLPTGGATSALQTSVGATAHTDAAAINTTLGTPAQQTGSTVGLVAGSAVIGHVINDASSAIIGKVGIDQTTPGTTNGVVINSGAVNNQPSATATSSGVTIVQSSALESNHVLKNSAGNLYSLYVTTGSVQGWLLTVNATSAPTAGGAAIAPVDCVYAPANTTTGISMGGDPPDPYATGIVAVFSSSGCLTNTASSTAFFKGRVK